MMRFLFCFFLFYLNVSYSQTFTTLTNGRFEMLFPPPPWEGVENKTPLMNEVASLYKDLPFSIGERMRFLITYMGVSAGYAETLVRTPIKSQNGFSHRISGEVKNADWYSWLVTLHDAIDSISSGDSLFLPQIFYMNQIEPSYKRSKLFKFDFKDKKVVESFQSPKNPKKDEIHELEENSKDGFSVLYYMRTHWKMGHSEKEFKVPIFTTGKTWQGVATFVGIETIEVLGNKYETDRYDLVAYFGHLMEQKGNIRLWLTRDLRRLPVQAEASIKIGYLKVRLQEWDPGFPMNPELKSFEKIRPR